MMVRNIIRNAQQSGEMQPQSRPSGRPRQTTELIDLVILQAVRTNQISSAPQIQQELKRHNVDVSCETIRRRVKEYNKNRLAVAVGPADNQTSGKGVLGLDPSRIELLLVQMEQHNSASKPATTKRPSTSASTKKRTTAKVPSKAPIQSSTKKKKHGDYSLEVRELCLKKHDEGMGLRDIGRELGMPYTTVRAIIKKIKATGTLERGKRTGRPKKTDDEADEVIIRTIAANPRCSAKQIQSELQNIDVNVSCETIRRRVKEFHRKQHSDLGLPILEAPATFAVSSLS
ncbi:TPA: hypothetical protein N0F65_007139 [Lagenidium giganteum]|uniref:Transposase n=1 Tax=Lagenidium giganteum TaxID=4803 RepID=A0AAV2YTI8_9STRA|nr:TPA: hypothetical protein N0F65_007139 [Lagenidium giganteum]